jgi:uncharacterized protein YbbC (DUF1343 family)
MPHVKTGLENFIDAPPSMMANLKFGLLCNPASVDRRYRHAREVVMQRFPGQLTALFSPQHGFFAEKQDNMVESDHMRDPITDLPVYSLYGETRVPTDSMFDPVDVLIVDLQDVGTRVYTFIYTLAHCMEKAQALGKKVVVLDRPNPIGGVAIEGNLLRPDCASFVGRYPIPMRHGLTIGEIARLFNETYGIGCDLTIVPMTGWQRQMTFGDTGLPWIPPSPNLPTPASTLVYPGQVIWEGTNISEGRGTAQPFELCGAPFIDTRLLTDVIMESPPDGVVLRPVVFEPTANKWSGESCRGFHLHVVDPAAFNAFETSLLLLEKIRLCHTDRFRWKSPPYEYEHIRQPIDLILGDKEIRRRLEEGDSAAALAHDWQTDLEAFRKTSRPFMLY